MTDDMLTQDTANGPRRAAISTAVKRLVLIESRLSIPPEQLSDAEPLNGDLLSINSLGFLGMLVRLEDELDVELPDDLFIGRTFVTVADLVAVVATGAGASR
jgi:acyl carrier protein